MWLESVGWVGSLLVVVSLVLADAWRFRMLNLAGAFLATAYNPALGIWPFVLMNGAIVLIDLWWLVRLGRVRPGETAGAGPDGDQVQAERELPPVRPMTGNVT